jgi:hypothetical protein
MILNGESYNLLIILINFAASMISLTRCAYSNSQGNKYISFLFEFYIYLRDEYREYGSRAPRHLNQLMPIRGLLPEFLKNVLYSQYRLSSSYVACMHQADADFVSAFDQIQQEDMLPSWWSQPEIAPEGAEGVSGYTEACALGLSSHGVCFVPLRTLFTTLIEVFRLSISRDPMNL